MIDAIGAYGPNLPAFTHEILVPLWKVVERS